MSECILIVDDEEPVRRTFREWLESADLDCEIVAAADAEEALTVANRQTIDLAVLDWNLGAGNDGLQLLEDLYYFNPNVVAVMVTGYAHQATPLAAMRMGVRDYLDKNQDLDRESFLATIRQQLERIRPAKRERQLNEVLRAFREAVAKILPLVQSSTAFVDPVPLPKAIKSLFQFLLQTTRARAGVLLVHSHDPERQPAEICRAYDQEGNAIVTELVPFAQSAAGAAVAMQQPCTMNDVAASAPAGVELQSFERNRRSILAAPLLVTPGTQVVFELFDKESGVPTKAAGFNDHDLHIVGAAAEFAADLFRHALTERQAERVLLDAVAAALDASQSLATRLATSRSPLEEPPPRIILDKVREGLKALPGTVVNPDDSLRLAEAIRVLVLRHGTSALHFCTTLVENLAMLLDKSAGYTDGDQSP